MTYEEIIARLRYKAENIKAKLEPSYFSECAEHLDRYRWHDLRKDPNDLPKKEYELVEVTLENKIVDIAIWNTQYQFRPWYSAELGDCPSDWENDVVAWREIDLFEVEV